MSVFDKINTKYGLNGLSYVIQNIDKTYDLEFHRGMSKTGRFTILYNGDIVSANRIQSIHPLELLPPSKIGEEVRRIYLENKGLYLLNDYGWLYCLDGGRITNIRQFTTGVYTVERQILKYLRAI